MDHELMRTAILTDKVRHMALDPQAKYPAEKVAFTKECFDMREMIKSWQRAQQHGFLKLVKGWKR
jgi:hypothetical protein